MNINFLGSIPVNLEARNLVNEVKFIVIENKETDISIEIYRIVREIEDFFNNH